MDDYRPEWDDRKELADVFQGACLFPVTGLSEAFYTALLRVANWGYDQRKQENTDDQDRAADRNPDVAAMLRLARADAYRQGVKDGRAQIGRGRAMTTWLHHRMCDECGERMRPMLKCLHCGKWFQPHEQEQKCCKRGHGDKYRAKRLRNRATPEPRKVFIYRCETCTATFAYT